MKKFFLCLIFLGSSQIIFAETKSISGVFWKEYVPNGETRKYYKAIRFFPDGKVMTIGGVASGMCTDPETFSTCWTDIQYTFHQQNITAYPHGNYTLDNNQVKFRAVGNTSTNDYVGHIDRDKLTLTRTARPSNKVYEEGQFELLDGSEIKKTYIPNEEVAKNIARAILTPIYGSKWMGSIKKLTALEQNGTWVVDVISSEISRPSVVKVKLDKYSGTVLDVSEN